MYSLSPSKQKALDTGQQFFKRGNFHPSYQLWRTRCIQNNGIYDGSGQWRQEDIDELKKIGQIPFTVNVTQGFIDAISGIELQTRHRTACRSFHERDDKLALAMTHVLFDFQTREKVPFKGTRKFRHHMICGIGWSNTYDQDETQYYETVDPLNVIPDFDDLSPQFEEMKYVCRKRWMWPDRLVKLWPHAKQYIDNSNFNKIDGVYSPEIDDHQTNFTNIDGAPSNNDTKVMVVEVQYKQEKKSYSGIDKNGYFFETFDEDKAEEFLDSSEKIEEKESHRIMRTLFAGNCLLEHSPLSPDIPSLNDFTYIPLVWKRESSTGIPYGIVDGLKDIQIDLNVRVTKSIYLINSSKTTIKGSLPPGQNIETIRKELKRRDSVIIVPPGTDIQIETNAPLGEEQFKIINEHLKLIQRVTGVNDEMLGIQTNAASAVSQNVRQMSSMRKNMFAFDNFTYMKLRESKFLLSIIQGLGLTSYINILDDDQRETILMNVVKESNGKKIILNNTQTLPLDLYIEEVPDYQSTSEEQREYLDTLLANPNGVIYLQSPYLLRMRGFRDPEKISEEIRKAMQERAMIEQGQQPGGAGPNAQMPPPANQMTAENLLQLK